MLAVPRRAARHDARRDADRQIDYWLERLSLRTPEKDWGQSKVDELSRGMQQKVQFIGTLLHDPDLVILDEPFSGLDPINAQALKDTVVELRKRGKTVIFSTHLMDNAERLCDSVCIIARGEKVLDGTVSAVKSRARRHAHRARAERRRRAAASRTVLSDTTLVTHVDDQNQFFELELARGATPQRLLERLVAGRRTHHAVRAGAAVAAPDLPPNGRRGRRRGGDEWSGLSCGR